MTYMKGWSEIDITEREGWRETERKGIGCTAYYASALADYTTRILAEAVMNGFIGWAPSVNRWGGHTALGETYSA